MSNATTFDAPSPGLVRRLACLLYESLLLFGVAVAAALLHALATRRVPAPDGAWGLKLWLFLVIGAYFVVCWSRLGQTLAMKTWHLRLVGPAGRPVGWVRATCRYLLSWLWFLPALLTLQLSGLHGGAAIAVVLTVGVVAYAALARLHPSRQTLHDLLCGTRVIDTRGRPPRPAAEHNASA